MDISPPGLHDRLGNLSRNDSTTQHDRDDISGRPTETFANQGEHLIQRCVIIQKDEKGYGLTVTGDNPVFVQCVKEDGAAARAGVQQGDRIIKVNGTLVTQSNHQEVVQLIKSAGSYVALTLLGNPPGHSNRSSGTLPPLNFSGNSQSSLSHTNASSKLSSPSERITGPQPVDPEKQQQLTNSRIHTIKKMLDKEAVYLDTLRADCSKTPSEKLLAEINGATKRVKTLEEQLHNLVSVQHDHSVPRSPRSPTGNRHPHSDKETTRSISSPSPVQATHQGRMLTHQISAPTLPKSDRFPILIVPGGEKADNTSWIHGNSNAKGDGLTLNAAQKQLSLSTSLENITLPLNSRATTWPYSGPTHSRQSSSPEALLQHVENLQHRNEGPKTVSDSLTRSYSEVGQHSHGRKSSSSDTFPETEVHKRRRQTNSSSRGSSFGQYDSALESPSGSPPGTPPPPLPPRDQKIGVEISDYGDQGENEDILLSEVHEENNSVQPSDNMKCLPPCIDTNTNSDTKPSFLNSADKSLSSVSLELNQTTSLTSPKQQYGTPPEGQISPASSLNIQNLVSKLSGQHPNIIPMEDDDFSSDNEMGHLEDHGPFNGFFKLVRNPAHLAVFMHYLIQNSDPSSLFFAMISELYEQGTGKEMKKWAYEIQSSFLVPGAPLKISNVDDTILHEIDDVLQHQLEKEEVLRAVFRKARKKAKEKLNELLGEFRSKRTMGLGSLFGPPDSQLEEAVHDKVKELKIIEQLLVPTLESYLDDFDNADDHTSAKTSALATLLKSFGLKNTQTLTLIDRCPTFVAKEKTRLRFLQRNKKVIFAQEHHFTPQHYYSVTYCNHCQLIIWGVGNQGYQCQNCEMNIHKLCVKVVEEPCIGALRNKKDKKRDRMSGIMENFISKTRKPSHPVPAAIERAKKMNEECSLDSGISLLYTGASGENQTDAEKTGSTGKLERSKDSTNVDDHISSANLHDDMEKLNHTKKGTSIGRSESFRQRRESRPSFRKRSDPNIPRSKSDVDVDDKSACNLDNSGSSSNSSLSTRSLDSPSNSLEMVHRTHSGTPADSIPAGSVPAAGLQSTHITPSTAQNQFDDSDLEAEADPPNWQENVDWEVIRMMKPKEKKRQEVINELFHTERTHVRNLKVLERLFYRPMLQEQLLPSDLLQVLFPNLEEILDIHSSFNSKMKTKRKEESVVGDVGDLMLQMFDGPSGENLKSAASLFCQNQTTALESLKAKQRKDQKLAQFLADAEAHILCRRLQLKDIIATGFQRLTKYPLLLENVAKYTAPNTEEHNFLLQAVECSKQILAQVNQAVKEAENQHHLGELQKKLDKSAFEKVEHPIAHNYKNLDLTNHRLLYDGPLTWRLNKQKNLEIHVVLLEDILVLLQKQDDKYILKFHNTTLMTGREDTKVTHSPILRVQNLLTRNVATDKRGFFLVSTSDQHAMYEFAAGSPAERKIWLRYIAEATESFKNKSGIQVKRSESSNLLPDRTESTEENSEDSESKSRESSQQQQDSQNEVQETSENGDSGEGTDSQSNKSVNVSVPSVDVPSTTESPSVSLQKDDDEIPSPEPERKPQSRLQRVEVLKIADGPQLIEPCEVVVSHGAILQTAEPVLTPIEQLRRKDQQITSALSEKEELVADILQLPREEFEHIAEIAAEMEGEKDARELALAAILQANRLAALLNESLLVTEEDTMCASSVEVMPNDLSSVTNSSAVSSTNPVTSVATVVTASTEVTTAVSANITPSPKVKRKMAKLPGVPSDKLKPISSTLNRCLTQLLSLVTEHEEERKQLRKELHNSKEQLHLLHESHRHCSFRSQSPSNHSISHSRPSSFISIASSTSEGMCDTNDQHFIPVLEKVNQDAQEAVKSGLCPSGVHQLSEECEEEDQDVQDPVQCKDECSEENRISEMFVDEPSEEIKSNCQVTDLDSDPEVIITESKDNKAHMQTSVNTIEQNMEVMDPTYGEDSTLNLNSQTDETSNKTKTIDPIYF